MFALSCLLYAVGIVQLFVGVQFFVFLLVLVSFIARFGFLLFCLCVCLRCLFCLFCVIVLVSVCVCVCVADVVLFCWLI